MKFWDAPKNNNNKKAEDNFNKLESQTVEKNLPEMFHVFCFFK